jgi:hypothetical protein
MFLFAFMEICALSQWVNILFCIMKQLPNENLRFQPYDFNIDQQIVYFLVHFKLSTSIEVWLGNYLKFTKRIEQ